MTLAEAFEGKITFSCACARNWLEPKREGLAEQPMGKLAAQTQRMDLPRKYKRDIDGIAISRRWRVYWLFLL